MQPKKLRIESLENRTVPSTINWVNDGDADDYFDDVWGAQADEARSAVRAGIEAWERVITDLHNGTNTLDLTIRMATDDDEEDFGFGGGDNETVAGQAPPGEIQLNGGRPTSGLILMGRGDGGHGAGWYVDPTPDEASEFLGDIKNAFVGAASEPESQTGVDFQSLFLAELTHVLGITSKTGSKFRDVIDASPAAINGVKLVDSGVIDKNYLGAVGDKPTLWAFDGPSLNYLMTDADGGNKGFPVHTASPATGNSVLYAVEVLKGNRNIGNAGMLSDHRYLVPNSVALMLQDVYGYTLASGGPERFGTFYTLKHSNGQVLVRGTTGGDTLAATRDAVNTFARADIAVPVPGTEPFSPLAGGFVSKYSNATVQAIHVEAGTGNDTVEFSGTFSGLDEVRAHGDTGNDRLDGLAATAGSLTMYGDDANDTVLGGAGNDNLFGGPGNDLLRGYGGGDALACGTGNDTGEGGTADDYLLGDIGNDFLQGNSGDDTVYAGSGVDRVVGGTQVPQILQSPADGADVLDGEAGTDLVIGDNAFGNAPHLLSGGGDDLVLGGTENDTLWGGVGDDTVQGEQGSDRIMGWFGNDSLAGGTGNDTLWGYDGNDRLDGEDGADIVYGDDGNDTAIGGLGSDFLRGGNDNDNLVGGTLLEPVFDASGDTLFGEAGNDTLFGDNVAFAPGNVGGNDRIEGGSGDDFLNGQAGTDLMIGGSGDDQMLGGDGNDSIVGGYRVFQPNVLAEVGADEIDGGAGNDRIIGDSGSVTPLFPASIAGGNDTITGGDGDDSIYGMLGNDSMDGGVGADQVYGQSGSDTIVGGDDADQLYGGDATDAIDGGAGNDLVLGQSGNDILMGGDGNDLVRGGTGRDWLSGDAGNDILLGEADGDSLIGGVDRDILIGGTGEDVVSGGDGDDLLINATTTFDGSDVDLGAIRAEWTSARTYEERVKNLRGISNPTFDQRLNGNRFLVKNSTVFHDGDADVLNGEAGEDWFFRKPVEDTTDGIGGETETG